VSNITKEKKQLLENSVNRLVHQRAVWMEILADQAFYVTERGSIAIRDKLNMIQEQINYYVELLDDKKGNN
jgi:hypothetical protein